MPTPCNSEEKLIDKRCCNCNSKLAEIKLQIGIVKIKCPRCGTINETVASIEMKPEGLQESYSVKA